MVLNVAAFVDDPIIKRELILAASRRNLALDLCGSIPGYKELNLKDKNYIYDCIMSKLNKYN